MKRRSLLLAVLVGVLGAGWAILVSLGSDSKVVAVSHLVIPDAGRSARRELMPLPEAGDARALIAPLVEPVSEPNDPGPEPEPAVVSSDQMADLVRRLKEIEKRRPLDFHHGAAGELQPFLSMSQEDEQRAAGLDEAVAILDEWKLSPRVRGALLALVGAWGGQAEVLKRCPDPGVTTGEGEAWRSAMTGLLCVDSEAGTPSGARIPLTDYLYMCPRDGVTLLPLELGRLPDASIHAVLLDVASQVVDEEHAWYSRNLAILALGTSIDERPDTLDLMTRLLFDSSGWGLQVIFPVCFVMAHARSDAAREVLLQYLEDSQVAEGLKPLVRLWMSDGPALPRELEVLAAPLKDRSASSFEKMGAVAGLIKRGIDATPEQAALIVELLVDALGHETDELVRLGIVSVLESIPVDARSFRALEQLLRSSPSDTIRLMAARGLGRVLPEFRIQARSVLMLARSGETDDGVLTAIEGALLALD